jgi:hypothetical protein
VRIPLLPALKIIILFSYTDFLVAILNITLMSNRKETKKEIKKKKSND